MIRRTLVMACVAANALASPHPFPAAAGRSAPRPEKRPKDVSVHGDVRIDPWFWLRERENPEVLAGLTRAGAAWAFTTFHESNWHPLTWLSHMADAQLFGADPAGHHATSARTGDVRS